MSNIRTSRHSIKFTNRGKKDKLSSVVDEYRRVGQIMVDEIWENGYSWDDKHGEHVFSLEDNKLQIPLYIDYRRFNIDTFLTARLLRTLSTQIAGMIRSNTEEQRKRIYMLDKFKAQGTPRKYITNLKKKIRRNPPRKPKCRNMNMEINSICSDWMGEDSGEFDGFIGLKSITKNKDEINIPIKFHEHSHKLSRDRNMMTSFLISKKYVELRWEKEVSEKKEDGEIVGADQGLKDVVTLSNGETTPKYDEHGHSLESIIEEMSRKKKGSKAFKRKEQHRKNFINRVINQLDLSNIKELRVEEIRNIGYKKRQKRKMSHWTNSLIRDKVNTLCEEAGVAVKSQGAAYRSQRCSECGIVRKANRKGKTYSCKHCGMEIDADLNASINHTEDLPEIPSTLRKSKVNRGNGFYWTQEGFFDFETGRSLQSLPLVEG